MPPCRATKRYAALAALPFMDPPLSVGIWGQSTGATKAQAPAAHKPLLHAQGEPGQGRGGGLSHIATMQLWWGTAAPAPQCPAKTTRVALTNGPLLPCFCWWLVNADQRLTQQCTLGVATVHKAPSVGQGPHTTRAQGPHTQSSLWEPVELYRQEPVQTGEAQANRNVCVGSDPQVHMHTCPCRALLERPAQHTTHSQHLLGGSSHTTVRACCARVKTVCAACKWGSKNAQQLTERGSTVLAAQMMLQIGVVKTMGMPAFM